MRRWVAAGVSGICVLALSVGCGVGTDPHPVPIPEQDVPELTSSPGPTST